MLAAPGSLHLHLALLTALIVAFFLTTEFHHRRTHNNTSLLPFLNAHNTTTTTTLPSSPSSKDKASPPPSPPPPTPQQKKWLIATLCPAHTQRRRNIIRTTWQTLYSSPLYTTRFILSDYDPVWDPLIQAENTTHGDIIRLGGLDPSPSTSNSIKAMELFKHLVSSEEGGGQEGAGEYAWVSKIDDDAFLSAHTFYSKFLNTTTTATQGENGNANTLIGRLSRNEIYNDFDWPGGAFYTLSWPLMERIVQQHTTHPVTDVPEDVLVGKYLHEGGVDYEFVNLRVEEMFDVPVEGAYVPNKIGRESLLVHMIKDDEMYLRVGRVFGAGGWNGGQIEGLTEEEEEEEEEEVHEDEGTKAKDGDEKTKDEDDSGGEDRQKGDDTGSKGDG